MRDYSYHRVKNHPDQNVSRHNLDLKSLKSSKLSNDKCRQYSSSRDWFSLATRHRSSYSSVDAEYLSMPTHTIELVLIGKNRLLLKMIHDCMAIQHLRRGKKWQTSLSMDLARLPYSLKRRGGVYEKQEYI